MYTENPLAVARKASMVPGTIAGNAISKEQNLELLLKSKKRANVFNQGIGKEQRKSFHAKHIPKTKKQALTHSLTHSLIHSLTHSGATNKVGSE